MRNLSKLLLFPILALVLSFEIGCGTKDTDNKDIEVVEAKFDTSIIKRDAVFNWESFNASGGHHNSGIFTITKKVGNYFELSQTSETSSTEVEFIGALITDKLSEGTVNFILINPQYSEVWNCTYIDEHTIQGTVLDGTFILTY